MTAKLTIEEKGARIQEQELDLRSRWIAIKLKLTDWLEESLQDLPHAEDYKGIKCIVDSVNQLEKLVGTDTPAPNTRDQIDTKDRTESILDKLAKSR